MSEPLSGTIRSVSVITLGDELAADAAAGSTTPTVVDASDFDAELGGTVAIGAGLYVYTVIDPDAGTLSIDPPLAAAAFEGDRVDVWDTAKNVAAVQYRADVELPGTLDGGDTVDALLASALVPQFTPQMGLRDPGTGETCTLQLQGGEWVVTQTNGGTVQVGTETLDPNAVVDGVQIAAAQIDDSDFIIDDTGGRTLVYAQSGQTIVTLTSGTSWTVPAGVTSVKVECWGGSGAGGGSPSSFNFGAQGGGGGEYAREDTYAVTPGANISYQVGSGGAAHSGAAGDNGGDTIFDTTGATNVTAHGGKGGNQPFQSKNAPGGDGSTNTVHFPGGNGHNGGGPNGIQGGGGGSSAGTAKAGSNGGAPSNNGTTGGSGGRAPAGGGAGGKGGDVGLHNGAAGSAPGGAGGGAGGSGGTDTGGAGAAGKIRLSYGGSLVLVASTAGVDGVDPVTGTAYPKGVRVYRADLVGPIGGYALEASFSRSTTSGSAQAIGNVAMTTVMEQSDYGLIGQAGSPWSSGTFTAPVSRFYLIDGYLDGVGGSTRTQLQVQKTPAGGGTAARVAGCTIESTGGTGYDTFARKVWLNQGDTVQWLLFHNATGSQTMTGFLGIAAL